VDSTLILPTKLVATATFLEGSKNKHQIVHTAIVLTSLQTGRRSVWQIVRTLLGQKSLKTAAFHMPTFATPQVGFFDNNG